MIRDPIFHPSSFQALIQVLISVSIPAHIPTLLSQVLSQFLLLINFNMDYKQFFPGQYFVYLLKTRLISNNCLGKNNSPINN